MEEQEYINLLRIMSQALKLATNEDQGYAMELLETASKQLDIPIPAIACNAL